MKTLPGARRTAAARLALAAPGCSAACGTSAGGEPGGDSLHPGHCAELTHAGATYAVRAGVFQKHRGYVEYLLVARA